jgi:hypothetical protein
MLPTFIWVDTCGSTCHSLKFWQEFVITSFLAYLVEAAYATDVFLALPDHLPELDILDKFRGF